MNPFYKVYDANFCSIINSLVDNEDMEELVWSIMDPLEYYDDMNS